MLTLVATPIGNLGDITLRALDALRQADVIASEDTRKTGFLLKHFDISKPQISFHEHNEDRAGPRIIEMLREGRSVCIVTDAGTPGVADPGYTIVRKAIEAGLPFTMTPGPSGAIMALVLSGLPTHSFTFRGFPPRKSGPRQRWFEVDLNAPHTLIVYESPFRVEATLRDALAALGDRQAALANDLTKKFEQVQRGPLSELLAGVAGKTLKGEYILVIEGVVRASNRKRDEERDPLPNVLPLPSLPSLIPPRDAPYVYVDDEEEEEDDSDDPDDEDEEDDNDDHDERYGEPSEKYA